ncbi:MAG: FAS1-like dehydratase domain-containing protein [Candidatus Hermodarchaeia archaeon]|jgi:hypothetical protein
MTEETFESLVEMFIEGTREILGKDYFEDYPEWPYATEGETIHGISYPGAHGLTRIISPIVLDERFIKLYSGYMGFDNPLFTNPEYAKKTRYGCLIAPGTILWEGARTISSHGVAIERTAGDPKYIRKEGYPIANFISGCAWEWYDIVCAGDQMKNTKSMTELIDKKGSRGRLLFCINRVMYWTLRGDLVGTATGTTTMVPRRSMGTQRSMDVNRVGQDLMYTRGIATYDDDDILRIVDGIEGEVIRGAEPRYWEDVEIGDTLSPMVLPPATIQDFLLQIRYCASSYVHGTASFDYEYERARSRFLDTKQHGHVNPVTMWPYGAGSEHDDHIMAKYRAQPTAFDQGRARLQHMSRLLYNWMGDDGFLRRMYGQLRKMYFYGDAVTFHGEVVKKSMITEKGEHGPGAVPGEETYCAVGVKITGKNQLGEDQLPGMARVYLPSREHGPVKLPIPHKASPPYIPFDTFRKDFY